MKTQYNVTECCVSVKLSGGVNARWKIPLPIPYTFNTIKAVVGFTAEVAGKWRFCKDKSKNAAYGVFQATVNAGLRFEIGVNAIVADASAFIEGGVYGTFMYDFVNNKWDTGVGGYVRGALEHDTWFSAKKRDQFKYTYGGGSADF